MSALPFGGEDFIPGLIDEIVSTAYEQHYQNTLRNMAPSFNASWFLSDVVRMAQWGTYKHDTELCPTHESEEEPTPAANDTWSRGAVPVRIKAQPKEDLYEKEVDPFKRTSEAPLREDTPSSGSRSNRSRVSISNGRASRQGKRSSKASDGMEMIGVVFEIPVQRQYEDDNSDNSRLLQALRAVSTPSTASLERDRSRREAALLEEQAREQRIEKQIREAKGRPYTIDGKGNVIIIQPPRGEGAVQSMGVATKEEGRVPLSGKTRGKKKGANGGAAGGGDEGADGGSKRARYSEDGSSVKTFYSAKCSAQPRLADGTVLYPGVSLKCGTVLKEGPPPSEDPQHISRKEYQLRKAREAALARGAASIRSGGGGQGGGAAAPTGDVSLAGSEMSSSIASPTPGRVPELPDELDEVDAYSGARQMEPPAKSAPAPIPDFDLQVTKAPDWGQPIKGDPQPGLLPHKPSTQQRRNVAKLFAGGHYIQFPRDRLLPGVVHFTAENTRMPPPPLGQVTGHGIMFPPISSMAAAQQAGGQAGDPTPRSEVSSIHLPLMLSPSSRASVSNASQRSKKSHHSYSTVKSGGVIKYHVPGSDQYVRRLLAV